MEAANSSAFRKECAIIEDRILRSQDVMLLKDLKVEYTAALEGTPFASPRYRI